MSSTISVLHLTAHLGGGIGKALAGLVLNTDPSSGISHTIVCLEPPEKLQFLERLTAGGCRVVVAPDHETLVRLIEAADLVQLEWWGHPVTTAALCRGVLPPMRLLVWNHVSGIHTPIIPKPLIETAACCLFTSPCSYEAAEVAQLRQTHGDRMGVVHSAGGFEGLEPPERRSTEPLLAGYLGSLNFAKLHPDYVEFLKAVPATDFTVRMVGDITNRDQLEEQCRRAGRPGMLEFHGYTTNIAAVLAEINVLPYLLNPRHYGTSENALLEAMAMGVVPVVLDNPAERHLVLDQETGLIVRTPEEFGAAIRWLAEHPEERLRMACRAAATVRERFTVTGMAHAFAGYYRTVCERSRESVRFDAIFGATPADWFLATQRSPELFTDCRRLDTVDRFSFFGLTERTKGSVFHYQNLFPDDPRLLLWAQHLHTVHT